METTQEQTNQNSPIPQTASKKDEELLDFFDYPGALTFFCFAMMCPSSYGKFAAGAYPCGLILALFSLPFSVLVDLFNLITILPKYHIRKSYPNFLRFFFK